MIDKNTPNNYDFTQDKTPKFICEFCAFTCNKKSDYNRHILTLKHKKMTNNDACATDKKYLCECGKIYKHRQNLHIHKKKCKYILDSIVIEDKEITKDALNAEVIVEEEIDYKGMFIKLMKENVELRNLLVTENKELRNQINELIPKVGNTNIKQKFNINLFLNEECKNALTMNEFIDTINITMDNLKITKDKGLAEGLSNILIENINKLSLNERPIHCTDMKRETMYIKCGGDNNKDGKEKTPRWEKDQENKKIKDALKKITQVQLQGLKKWVDKHPEWEENSQLQEEYMLLIKKCTDDLKLEKREDKVIKNLCNKVYIKGEE